MASGFTQAQLDALIAAYASGELRVSYGDHTVEYRSIGELKEAINTVRNGLAADAGAAPSRMVRAWADKGTSC